LLLIATLSMNCFGKLHFYAARSLPNEKSQNIHLRHVRLLRGQDHNENLKNSLLSGCPRRVLSARLA
jgi:hypothetical protein